MVLEPQVFKAYDVRGLYPKEFDADGAAAIAAALVSFLRTRQTTKRLVLARDMRPSSPEIADAVREAWMKQGIVVVDIGQATTPLFYFAINHLKADGGIMVTASHNPAGFNGLKLMAAGAESVGEGAGMEEVKAMALEGRRGDRASGRVERANVLPLYIDFLLQQAGTIGAFTLAIDAGNGMAGLVLEELLPKLPQLTVHKLFFDPDGTFPNHEANPIKEETLRDLVVSIKETRADLGIAFDGDADRVRFVTSDGKPIGNDIITAFLASQILRSGTKEAVVHTVTASHIVPETVTARGGIPVRTRVGHAFILRAMKEHNAVFGGEHSGHFYWPEFNFRESAVFTMLKVLAAMTRHKKSFEELIMPLEVYIHSGERNFEVYDKALVLGRVEAAFAGAHIDKLDGLTVEYDDWWFNLRPSNTEDLVRLNVEAKNQDLLDQKLKILRTIIQQ